MSHHGEGMHLVALGWSIHFQCHSLQCSFKFYVASHIPVPQPAADTVRVPNDSYFTEMQTRSLKI